MLYTIVLRCPKETKCRENSGENPKITQKVESGQHSSQAFYGLLGFWLIVSDIHSLLEKGINM